MPPNALASDEPAAQWLVSEPDGVPAAAEGAKKSKARQHMQAVWPKTGVGPCSAWLTERARQCSPAAAAAAAAAAWPHCPSCAARKKRNEMEARALTTACLAPVLLCAMACAGELRR